MLAPVRLPSLILVIALALPAMVHAKANDEYEIVAVDTRLALLTLTQDDRVTTVEVRPDATVTINGVQAAFSDLVPKLKVKVTLADPGVAQGLEAYGLVESSATNGSPSPSPVQIGPSVTSDGLAGIPLGSTQDQVRAAMAPRGVTIQTDTTPDHLHYHDGSIFDIPVREWHFYFLAGKLYKASAAICPPESQQLSDYISVKQALSKEYGDPITQTINSGTPEEISASVRNGSTTVDAVWRVGSSGSNTMQCEWYKRAPTLIYIRFVFQDDLIDAQVAATEKAALSGTSSALPGELSKPSVSGTQASVPFGTPASGL